LADHFGRCVEADDLRAALGDFLSELAGATTEIQNAFAGFGIEKVDNAFA
jgi:hypothetical protein